MNLCEDMHDMVFNETNKKIISLYIWKFFNGIACKVGTAKNLLVCKPTNQRSSIVKIHKLYNNPINSFEPNMHFYLKIEYIIL
jgi:hypothetical protein